MSDSDSDVTAPPTEFTTRDTHAVIESEGLQWSDDGEGDTGRINLHTSRGRVALSMNLLDDDEFESLAGATGYFEPEQAREIASAFERNESGEWSTDACTMWLNWGWLRHDGPRIDEDHSVTLAYDGDRLRIKYEREDGMGTVDVRGEALQHVLEGIAESMVFQAARADEYEPPDPDGGEEAAPRSRIKRFLATALPFGAILGVTYLVLSWVDAGLESSQATINGEPFLLTPDPVVLVSLLAFFFLVVWAIQWAPGKVSVGR